MLCVWMGGEREVKMRIGHSGVGVPTSHWEKVLSEFPTYRKGLIWNMTAVPVGRSLELEMGPVTL